uniref:Large ribosomal subunit protein eL36 n=1 Tax=Molossus molossus TaxID=27622 RepID=A0A7J8GRF6_MOLMO|nr:hypothetical protein HJG59_011249 [Molossus molossus]
MGFKKGHKLTKSISKPRHSHRHGHLTKHTKFMQDMIRELCGFAFYKQHTMELLKFCKDKRALKFIKKSVGTHIHAKRKREEMNNVLAVMRKVAARREKKIQLTFFSPPLLILERQEEEGDRDRNIDEREHQLAASCMPPIEDLAYNLGMCPDRELNWQPLGA